MMDYEDLAENYVACRLFERSKARETATYIRVSSGDSDSLDSDTESDIADLSKSSANGTPPKKNNFWDNGKPPYEINSNPECSIPPDHSEVLLSKSQPVLKFFDLKPKNLFQPCHPTPNETDHPKDSFEPLGVSLLPIYEHTEALVGEEHDPNVRPLAENAFGDRRAPQEDSFESQKMKDCIENSTDIIECKTTTFYGEMGQEKVKQPVDYTNVEREEDGERINDEVISQLSNDDCITLEDETSPPSTDDAEELNDTPFPLGDETVIIEDETSPPSTDDEEELNDTSLPLGDETVIAIGSCDTSGLLGSRNHISLISEEMSEDSLEESGIYRGSKLDITDINISYEVSLSGDEVGSFQEIDNDISDRELTETVREVTPTQICMSDTSLTSKEETMSPSEETNTHVQKKEGILNYSSNENVVKLHLESSENEHKLIAIDVQTSSFLETGGTDVGEKSMHLTRDAIVVGTEGDCDIRTGESETNPSVAGHSDIKTVVSGTKEAGECGIKIADPEGIKNSAEDYLEEDFYTTTGNIQGEKEAPTGTNGMSNGLLVTSDQNLTGDVGKHIATDSKHDSHAVHRNVSEPCLPNTFRTQVPLSFEQTWSGSQFKARMLETKSVFEAWPPSVRQPKRSAESPVFQSRPTNRCTVNRTYVLKEGSQRTGDREYQLPTISDDSSTLSESEVPEVIIEPSTKADMCELKKTSVECLSKVDDPVLLTSIPSPQSDTYNSRDSQETAEYHPEKLDPVTTLSLQQPSTGMLHSPVSKGTPRSPEECDHDILNETYSIQAEPLFTENEIENKSQNSVRCPEIADATVNSSPLCTDREHLFSDVNSTTPTTNRKKMQYSMNSKPVNRDGKMTASIPNTVPLNISGTKAPFVKSAHANLRKHNYPLSLPSQREGIKSPRKIATKDFATSNSLSRPNSQRIQPRCLPPIPKALKRTPTPASHLGDFPRHDVLGPSPAKSDTPKARSQTARDLGQNEKRVISRPPSGRQGSRLTCKTPSSPGLTPPPIKGPCSKSISDTRSKQM